jgi:hypothetical protein
MLAIVIGVIIGLFLLLFYVFPWTLAVLIGSVLLGVVVWHAIKPQDYYEIYEIYENSSKVTAFFVSLLNPIRQATGRMPIWIIPGFLHNRDGTLLAAFKAIDAIQNTLKNLDWPRRQKLEILRQSYLLCEKVVKGIWKLWSVDKTREAARNLNSRDSQAAIELLWKQTNDQIDSTVQSLINLSIQLINHDTLATGPDELLHQLIDLNQQMDLKLQKVKPYVKSSLISVWSYTMAFLVVVLTFTVSSKYIPEYTLPTVVFGSLTGFLIIGILHLRANNQLSEESLKQIVIALIKIIGINRKSG